jgi:hypothetical protein
MTDRPRNDPAATRDSSAPTPRAGDEQFDEDVDDASEASFPASDPPPWMGLRVGPPRARRDARSADRPPMREPDGR